ncbi:methyltransferase domain-containing protein [Klebsiella variicola subsp. variicola]|nr:methyltransferase domain-containing protein [Klebsiella variicola subsp. variicola]MCS6053385.1 methyltransferase domain-containing protein [Klebsiella variicola subsp. variicola]MDN2605154.1 methyltransferase domain-containing protein [Klebsiella variicola]
MGSSFYRSFEERHRGSVEDIKNRLSFYLPFLSRLKDLYPEGVIADIGCGRGEWLEILTENGIANIGVDLDDGMLARAKEAGLNVQKMDCLQFLQNQADQSLIALTGFHIAEHLPFEVLQQLVMHTLRVLKPGGLLILETPNPENVSVGTCSFYMDPTHNHPLPPPLLEFLPIHYGFNRAITVRLQEKEALKSPDAAVNLVDVLKGVSPDYSIIAQKAAPADVLERFETLFTQQYGLTLDVLSNRYDAILRQQFSSFASQLETLNQTYTRQLSKMAENIQTLQGQVDELNHVIGQNNQLHQQVADLHNSRSWRITQPLRWLSLQRQLLRQEGAKVRARRAAKKNIAQRDGALAGLFPSLS